MLPDDAVVFAGNSMPVRDLDTFFPGGPQPARFLANRGASGIDGVVSSALGARTKASERLVLMIGDISFYHDMNGLLAAKRYGLDVTIVLLNNDGGGIFSFLPQYDDPEHYEDLFGTPHGLDFRPAAALYDLPFETVETPAGYRAALEQSFDRGGTSIIEVKTDRNENLQLHRRLWQEVAAALHQREAK
jgi:2-succinyl-5-enolpyruvyl-6-hydroxy-3-cyclohexene-1-carboxylate synthase